MCYFDDYGVSKFIISSHRHTVLQTVCFMEIRCRKKLKSKENLRDLSIDRHCFVCM